MTFLKTDMRIWLAHFLLILLPTCAATVSRGQEPVRSEPYVWKNVKIVAGGFIPGIVFSRAEKGLAYCRTDIGGCYRWDDATNQWIPLQDSLAESNYLGGESIAPDPIDRNTVYIAAGMYSADKAAMLRSRDKGKTWSVFPVPFRMGGNEPGRGMGERLAIDPHDNHILYFGSRHEGLWRSVDSAQTWKHVDAFPLKGLGNPPAGFHTHGGLSFVVIDQTGKQIFVGSADPANQHLFRSDDAGASWRALSGGPPSQLLPAKGALDRRGNLIITCGNGIGPNDVTNGAVWKLNIATGKWTDITPEKSSNQEGGYCGLSVSDDGQTIAVSTIDRWHRGDTVWRTIDAGQTWKDIAAQSTRDISASPYLLWGQPQPKLGWWMSALAVDPFNPDHAAYGTGATLYACDDFTNVSKDYPTHWQVGADGIEETAVITLLSPAAGPHLLSGMGDIGGFVHDDLGKSPPGGMYDHPLFGNTNTLDYAEKSPNVIVRSGSPSEGQASLAWSQDSGKSWQPIASPAQASATQPSRRHRETPAIVVSADGSTFLLATPTPLITHDRGKTWSQSKGLPLNARPIPDGQDPSTFYAIDFDSARLYISADAATTFTPAPSAGLPSDIRADAPTWQEAPWPLIVTPGIAGDLWFVSHAGLYHSLDRGAHFTKVETNLQIQSLGFGKAPTASANPALYAIGTMSTLKAIWRSDDSGLHWIRINDDQHQYGTRFRCIAGDPRIFGRVYVGTDGRGILYADPTPLTGG